MLSTFFIRICAFSILVLAALLARGTAGLMQDEFSIASTISALASGQVGPLFSFLLPFIFFIITLGVGCFLFLKRSGHLDDLFQNQNNVASAGMGKKSEFKGITGTDGVPIAKNFRLSEKKSFEHVKVTGPTGSGKSAAVMVNALLDLPAHASVVVTDPKGELFEKTAQHALDRGKNVIVFSPFEKTTMRYNPLALCRNISEIRELAQVLLANGNASVENLTGTKSGGSEWTNMATPLLSAFLIYVHNLQPPHNTVSKAMDIIVDNDLETLQAIMEDGEEEAKQQFDVFMQSAGAESTASSIKTVLATSLQMFTDPLVQNVTAYNDIHPSSLREAPTHLYCIIPEHKSSFFSPLMSPFYSQLMNHLVESKGETPIYFLLDEFANIGKIPNIDVLLATVRSRRISITLGIQSINQLQQRYGDSANTILDNLKTKVFFPGLSHDSAEFASKLIGHKEIESVSTSYSKQQDTSYSVSKQKREVMSPDEIRRLEDETLLIISDNRNPIVDKQDRYYKNKRLFALSEKSIDLDEYIESHLDD